MIIIIKNQEYVVLIKMKQKLSPNRLKVLIALFLIAFFFLLNPSHASEEIRIPMKITHLFGEKTIFLYATLYKPDGKGPFPLVVINHGTPRDMSKKDRIFKFSSQSKEFVKRGFVVVVPMRRGYGGSEGNYAESYGRCENPDYYNVGMESAKDIKAVIQYMTEQSYVDKNRILVVGQSSGGFGSLALGSMKVDGLMGIINFAGVRGSIKEDFICSPVRLSQATYEFAKTSKVPTLWIYTENDKFVSPSVSKEMFDSYIKGGGKGKFILLPPFKQDGHSLFGDVDGIQIWMPIVDAFLKEIGL
ncbi:MAG: prolyl oligopeptidase family serine peptidase [Thermodesulfovibrionales bacterium]|nr:prolyl oligopeptidase family serine peptidase [Thermodesulfovibrionales bacterium]